MQLLDEIGVISKLNLDDGCIRYEISLNKNAVSYTHLISDDKMSVSQALDFVNEALLEKGYNPINQIIGYLLSGDSSYITGYKNARSIIKKFERDEILEEVIQYYLNRK